MGFTGARAGRILALIGVAVSPLTVHAALTTRHGAALAAWRYIRPGLIVWSCTTHAAIYVGLAALFAATLLPGREPAATRFARLARGDLPPELLAYTRRVTWAWCLFFAAQPAISLLLLAFAPLAAWSLFVNVLNIPLMLAMFAAEYLYRILRYPHYRHDTLAETLRVFGRMRSDLVRRAGEALGERPAA